MPDALFEHPRLAAVYDALDGERDDLDLYLELVSKFDAASLLDIGCGTGSLACRLARAGVEVLGLDPAGASLDVARRKPGADRVRWMHGTVAALASVPSLDVNMVTMTGNVAQVFTADDEWAEVLAAARRALRPGGVLVFETRDPARRAWEGWTRDKTESRVDTGDGWVQTWTDLVEVAPQMVTFRHTCVFESDGEMLTSESTLRFRDQGEVLAALDDAGFTVLDVLDAPDRPGLELVFVAQSLAG